MALKVNPPAALRLPDDILKDPSLRPYFQDVQTILFQLWSKTGAGNGPIMANNGGTGFDEYAVGDVLYADTTSTLARLPKPADKAILTMTAAGMPAWKVPAYGSFYDTTDQTAAAINTAYAMTFNSTDLSNGVTIGTPTSRVIVYQAGIYNFQFSTQLDKSSGGVGLIFIWSRKNGVDVANSAGQLRIQGNNAELLAAWNWLIELEADDYVELMFAVDDTSVQIISEPASGVVPAIPSVILTVTNNISA